MSKKIRLIALIFTLVWMALIFKLSNEPAEESSEKSGPIAYHLVNDTQSFLGLNWDEEKILYVAYIVEKVIRKIAHMTEYAVLACLLGLSLDVWRKTDSIKQIRKRCVFDGLLCALYSCSDEFHQTFIPGRYGKITDIGFDCLGVIAALLLVTVVIKRVRERA